MDDEYTCIICGERDCLSVEKEYSQIVLTMEGNDKIQYITEYWCTSCDKRYDVMRQEELPNTHVKVFRKA